MKQTASSLLAALAICSLAACGTAPVQDNTTTAPALTPNQIATQICPALQVTIPAMQAIPGLPSGAYADLDRAAQLINGTSGQPGLCAAAKVLSAADVQSLEQVAFGLVLPLVQASNPKLGAELEAAQIVVGFVNAIEAGAQAGAPATATMPAAK